jgi:DNA-binding Lrp family transcriptional regulator
LGNDAREQLKKFFQDKCKDGAKYQETIKEILNELKKPEYNVSISAPTLIKLVTELEEEGFINIGKGKPTIYSLNSGGKMDADLEYRRLSSEVEKLINRILKENKELKEFKESLEEIGKTSDGILYRQVTKRSTAS